MTDEQRETLDTEIARAWPERWAKANEQRPGGSKRRNNIRKAYLGAMEHAAFVATNPHARCSNCRHLGHKATLPKPFCELDSDFYGYQTVVLDHVCTRWENPNAD